MSVSILVVDDEPNVAEMFRQHFRREVRQGTYVLHFAGSGEEALDRLSNGVSPELRSASARLVAAGQRRAQTHDRGCRRVHRQCSAAA
jgi:CheY-like chemotaxis protein